MGYGSGGRIERTYCSGEVETTSASYFGAFGGSVGANLATNSHYDAGATAREAVNSGAYTGITAVESGGMTSAASFPAFDFEETWNIEEGETMPYLRCFRVFEINSFADWLADRNLPGDAKPWEVVNGIPLGGRYVFGIDAMDSELTADNEPVFRIASGGGKPFVQFAPRKRGGDGEAALFVSTTEDLAADPVRWSDPVPVDFAEGVYRPAEPAPAVLFVRWIMHVAGYDD